MNLFELGGGEKNELYQELQLSNTVRQYDFLRSIVLVALKAERPYFSQAIIKALNYHAISCLHTNAGEYRPIEVEVGEFQPPLHHRVSPLMDDFVNLVNRYWEQSNSIELSAYVLWQLNLIHPFVNGNGRTARAACHFVLCLKSGGWLSSPLFLPELLRQNREEYVAALKEADQAWLKGKGPSEIVAPLSLLILNFLDQDS